jgi:hypothetical protein
VTKNQAGTGLALTGVLSIVAGTGMLGGLAALYLRMPVLAAALCVTGGAVLVRALTMFGDK